MDYKLSFVDQTKPNKYERNQQFGHVWEQKYLSRCYNNSYEQPKFLWYSQPHSQTFHQVRQGVMPLHLGKQGTKGGTKHETGWLMMPFQVAFFQIRHWLMLPNLQWCLVFVRKCRKNVTIFMGPHIHDLMQLQNPKFAGERICQLWKSCGLVCFTILKDSFLKQQIKFDFMDVWLLLLTPPLYKVAPKPDGL